MCMCVCASLSQYVCESLAWHTATQQYFFSYHTWHKSGVYKIVALVLVAKIYPVAMLIGYERSNRQREQEYHFQCIGA